MPVPPTSARWNEAANTPTRKSVLRLHPAQNRTGRTRAKAWNRPMALDYQRFDQ